MSYIVFLSGWTKAGTRIIFIILILFSLSSSAQKIEDIALVSAPGLQTGIIILQDSTAIPLVSSRPLFSFLLDGKLYRSSDSDYNKQQNTFVQNFGNRLKTVTAAGKNV
mgnify:CR=1 FL=1